MGCWVGATGMPASGWHAGGACAPNALLAPTLALAPTPQDEERGGISDRPEDMADVYHTFFGIAGLSLMGRPGLAPIDPTFALPVEVVRRLRERREGSGQQQQTQRQAQQTQQEGQQAQALAQAEGAS